MAEVISINKPEIKRKAAKPSDNPAPAKRSKEQDQEERVKQVMEWRRQARLNQNENRREMAIDQDYFDHIQWSEEDKRAMEERGQAPLVFNLIAVTVRWVTGTEKRTRIDFRVMGRHEDDLKPAQAKTSLLKYLSDANKDGFNRSQAFADAAIVGLGWLEDGIKNDPEDEPLYCRSESWRNMWYDPLHKEMDMSDARFLFREKWVDLDIAVKMFPDKRRELEQAADNILTTYQTNQEFNSSSFNPYLYGDPDTMGTVYGEPGDVLGMGTRKRVLLSECWYRTPENVKILKTVREDGIVEPFHGKVFRKNDMVHQWAVKSGLATTHDAVRMNMNLMILCVNRNASIVLQDGPTPYWHNRFPFTPVWGYRRGRDNAPYGLVRGLRDAQDDLNKRRAKALQLLSTKQVIADKGAVDNKDEAQQEVARPDGWIEKNPGKELEIRDNTNLAPAQVNLMDYDARYIQEAAGVTDENLGRQTNAISGKAIESRQNQGYTTTSDLFDNLRLAIQITGERRLALIEQYYDEPKMIRLTGERKNDFQFLKLNDQEGLNPITASQADFVVDEQDYRGTIRQAMFDTIMEMVPKLPPEISLKLLTLAFEMSDVPMRDEFVRVLREATGMKDPNEEQSPEELVKQAQDQQAQAEQAALAQRQVMANLQLLEGKAREAAAKGDKAELEALNQKLQALQSSIDVAGKAAAAPHVAAAADQIMQDAMGVPTVNNIAPPLPAGV